jgi:hypothetical protein
MKQILPFIKNIKGGPKTTIVGAVLMGIALVKYFLSDYHVEITVDVPLFGIGLILLFLKDAQKNGGVKIDS